MECGFPVVPEFRNFGTTSRDMIKLPIFSRNISGQIRFLTQFSKFWSNGKRPMFPLDNMVPCDYNVKHLIEL